MDNEVTAQKTDTLESVEAELRTEMARYQAAVTN